MLLTGGGYLLEGLGQHTLPCVPNLLPWGRLEGGGLRVLPERRHLRCCPLPTATLPWRLWKQQPLYPGLAAASLRPDLPGDQVRGRSGDVMVPEAGPWLRLQLPRYPRRGTGQRRLCTCVRDGGGAVLRMGPVRSGPVRSSLLVSVPEPRESVERCRWGARPRKRGGSGRDGLRRVGQGVSDAAGSWCCGREGRMASQCGSAAAGVGLFHIVLATV